MKLKTVTLLNFRLWLTRGLAVSAFTAASLAPPAYAGGSTYTNATEQLNNFVAQVQNGKRPFCSAAD